MELRELVGLHELSGVDHLYGVGVEREYGGTEYADVLRFTLDGVTYVAREDPDDGYRSMLRDITISDEPTVNQFSPVQVLAVWRDRWGGLRVDRADVLELLTMTGECVLAVGTEHSDDYYPSFVAAFHLEALGEVTRLDQGPGEGAER